MTGWFAVLLALVVLLYWGLYWLAWLMVVRVRALGLVVVGCFYLIRHVGATETAGVVDWAATWPALLPLALV